MKWIVRVYSFILLAYTGWRTLDFMQSQLPKNDLSFWLSIIFLFSTEAGLLIWHELALSHVTTETQERIAKTMTGIDFVGSTAAGIADMILRQNLIAGYQVPAWLGQFLIFGLPLIVGGNVGAVLLYIWFDGDKWIEREKRQTLFEIKKAAIISLQAERKAIAADKKGLVHRTIKAEIINAIDSEFGNLRTTTEQAPQIPHPSTNGHNPRPAEGKPATVTYNSDTEAAAAEPPLSVRSNHPGKGEQ